MDSGSDPTPRDDGDYEMVRDAIIDAFNPTDKDEAEEAILCDAVNAAAEFVRLQPCSCDDEPCTRCLVLGEFRGVRGD